MSDPVAAALEPKIQALDELELAAFNASVMRMTRAGFELRSAEAAHERISRAYLSRLGLRPEEWLVNPANLDKGVLVLVPKPASPPEKKDVPQAPAGPPAAAAAPVADPPAAATVPPSSQPGRPGALAAGTEIGWEEPRPVTPIP